jgi:hypothetical protein
LTVGQPIVLVDWAVQPTSVALPDSTFSTRGGSLGGPSPGLRGLATLVRVTRRAALILVLWLIAGASLITVAAVAKVESRTPWPSRGRVECPQAQAYAQACEGP